jgi:phage tail sheath gpL-like
VKILTLKRLSVLASYANKLNVFVVHGAPLDSKTILVPKYVELELLEECEAMEENEIIHQLQQSLFSFLGQRSDKFVAR